VRRADVRCAGVAADLPAEHFRWLTPTECGELLRGDGPGPVPGSLYDFPDGKVPLLGGFAYLYPEPEKANYFMLLAPPKPDKEMIGLRGVTLGAM